MNEQNFEPVSVPSAEKKYYVVATIVGVLLVGYAAAYAYFNYLQAPSLEQVAEKIAAKMAEVETVEYSGDLELETQYKDQFFPMGMEDGEEISNSYVKVSFSGAADLRDKENLKSMVRVFAQSGKDADTVMAAGVEIRNLGEDIYFTLTDALEVEFLDLSFLEDKWVKVNISELEKRFGGGKFILSPGESDASGELSVEEEEIAALRTSFWLNGVMQFTDKLPSEEISGVVTYHYGFILNKEGLEKFMKNIALILGEEEMTETDLEGMEKGLEMLDVFAGEIWIGKRDLLPRKITLHVELEGMAESPGNGVLDVMFLITNFNQNIEIKAPENSESIEDVLSEMFSGFSEGLNFEVVPKN